MKKTRRHIRRKAKRQWLSKVKGKVRWAELMKRYGSYDAMMRALWPVHRIEPLFNHAPLIGICT